MTRAGGGSMCEQLQFELSIVTLGMVFLNRRVYR
jgi:hypothetical protein